MENHKSKKIKNQRKENLLIKKIKMSERLVKSLSWTNYFWLNNKNNL